MRTRIQAIRSMIQDGMSDDEIADACADADADAAEHDALYGPNDYHDGREFGGPAHLSDDGYYAKNEAGEYSWM